MTLPQRFRRHAATLATSALLLAACSAGSEPVERVADLAAEPTTTTVPTTAPVPTATPEPTATPVPTATPEPTPLPTATAEPTATATPEPTATTEPTATSEPTEEPTSIPAPPAEPTATEGTGAAPTAAPTEVVVPIVDGSAIYANNCAGCHGAQGQGGRARAIAGIGGFFAADPSPLVNLVTNGGTNMPAFGTRLTSAEISAVVDYVVAAFS